MLPESSQTNAVLGFFGMRNYGDINGVYLLLACAPLLVGALFHATSR